jgi:hypothetical protein
MKEERRREEPRSGALIDFPFSLPPSTTDSFAWSFTHLVCSIRIGAIMKFGFHFTARMNVLVGRSPELVLQRNIPDPFGSCC